MRLWPFAYALARDVLHSEAHGAARRLDIELIAAAAAKHRLSNRRFHREAPRRRPRFARAHQEVGEPGPRRHIRDHHVRADLRRVTRHPLVEYDGMAKCLLELADPGL